VVRITIVNFFGNLVLDTLVKPWGKVLDYRESITNIRKQDLLHAPSFPKVVQIVSEL
jgi:DNA polymerase III epsilon subunit-like protein